MAVIKPMVTTANPAHWVGVGSSPVTGMPMMMEAPGTSAGNTAALAAQMSSAARVKKMMATTPESRPCTTNCTSKVDVGSAAKREKSCVAT